MLNNNDLNKSLNKLADCDVLIAGGGVAGISAALSASRNGAKTILLEREFALGGLASLGLVTYYLPLCDGLGHQVCFGIAEELLRMSIEMGNEGEFPNLWLYPHTVEERKQQRFRTRFNAQLFALLAEEKLKKSGVEILYGVQISDAIVEQNSIKSVFIHSRTSSGLIKAKVFIDATGDATLIDHAGEETRIFQQGNILAAWYYLQDSEGYNLRTLGTPPNLLMTSRFTGLDAIEVSQMIKFSHEKILEDIRAHQKKNPGCMPATLPAIPQLRKTRRLEGTFVLDHQQVHCHQESSIGMAGDWRKPGPVYELPFEILYGKNICNLYACGRCVSVTNTMMDILRVIPPCVVTGQAAGTAAALQSKEKSRPEITLLQETLQNDGVIIHEK